MSVNQVYVIATFENSLFIELAISEMEQKGIPKEKILAAPLDKRSEPRQLFDTLHRADGLSLFDGAAMLGTCFMLLGAIYGYVLKWGPIIWGIIGAVSGLLLGFLIKMLLVKNKQRGAKSITAEIVLMIRCEEHQWETIEKILWENTALGITRINNGISPTLSKS
ncbi:SoxR reducing system RseC family protein [Bacillus sp. X1(2014)]|uniref:SoxR reducing system RseC family protein n=1 Tax=Bacillus sp. X1(2014) TaxID=1565991 RepID=UPI0021B230C4|nr:SoxR reducing system RseC family protein [Bacillus sp. X1(2014)]